MMSILHLRRFYNFAFPSIAGADVFTAMSVVRLPCRPFSSCKLQLLSSQFYY